VALNATTFGQLADRPLVLKQELDHSEAVGVGERAQALGCLVECIRVKLYLASRHPYLIYRNIKISQVTDLKYSRNGEVMEGRTRPAELAPYGALRHRQQVLGIRPLMKGRIMRYRPLRWGAGPVVWEARPIHSDKTDGEEVRVRKRLTIEGGVAL